MWDLRGPGFEPVSPALAGRFSTSTPPGKPLAKPVAGETRSEPGELPLLGNFVVKIPHGSPGWNLLPKDTELKN